MKQLFSLSILSVFILILLSFFSFAASLEEKDCLYYFYGKDCPQCSDSEKLLQQMEAKYPQLNIKKFEVYFDRENEKVMNKYFDSYHISEESRGVPALFMKGSYFIGATSMQNLLEGRILTNSIQGCPSIDEGKTFGIIGEKATHKVLNTIALSDITKAAVQDSFRLGMLAAAVILLSVLISIKDGQKSLRRGAIFVGVLFFVHVLFSFGFFSWLASSSSYMLFTKLTGIFALGFGAIKMKELFTAGKSLNDMQMIRLKMQKKSEWLELPLSAYGVLAISFIASLFSLGKTNSMFELLKTFSVQSATRSLVFHLIIYYLLIAVLPVALIVIGYYFLTMKAEHHARTRDPPSDMKIERWRKHNWRLIEFIVGSLVFLLGLILIAS